MPLEHCPKCDRQLGPPLKSSGRQVCAKCGWSDKPRQQSAAKRQEKPELSVEEMKRLLHRAEAEALENMKPRKQQPQNPLQQIQQNLPQQEQTQN